jgi:hypothetical protein
VTDAELRLLLLEDEEGRLPPERRRALEAALADPAARRTLVEHYAVSAALRVHLGAMRANEERLGPAFTAGAGAAARRPRRVARLAGAAIVAGALAVAIVALVRPPREEAQAPPRPARAWSAVTVRGTVDGPGAPPGARAGSVDALAAGAVLTVSRDGLAVLSHGRTRVQLAGGARARIGATTGQGAQVVLEVGSLSATVPPGEAPLVVEAPHAQTSLAAGALSVRVRARSTLVAVVTGEARVQTPVAARTLAAGEAVVADGRGLNSGLPEETRAALALSTTADQAEAETAGVRTLALLRRPPAALIKRVRGNTPDAAGAVLGNEREWLNPEPQIFGVRLILSGLVLRDHAAISDGLRAAEATFARQRPEGGFDDGDPVRLAKLLAELGYGLLTLLETPEGQAHAERAQALLPAFRRAADHLAQPGQLAELRGRGQAFQAHLFTGAEVFAYAGELLGDEAMAALGAEFYDRALSHARPDGSLAMRDGTDSVYQGIMLHMLGRRLTRHPDERGAAVLGRGGRWLRGRITSDGRLDAAGNTEICAGGKTRCDNTDWSALAWALVFHGAAHDDPSAFTDAERLLQRRRLRLPAR